MNLGYLLQLFVKGLYNFWEGLSLAYFIQWLPLT